MGPIRDYRPQEVSGDSDGLLSLGDVILRGCKHGQAVQLLPGRLHLLEEVLQRQRASILFLQQFGGQVIQAVIVAALG